MADLEIQLSEIKHKAERAKIKLNDQDTLVKDLLEQARETKQRSRECIVKLFAELDELLHKKRTELLTKEYDAYLPVETTLSACTHSVHIGLRAVTELLDDAEVEAGRRVPIERLRLMTTVINDEIEKCVRLIENAQIPKVFVANSAVKDVIGGLQYGETESVEADHFLDSSDRNENTSENESNGNATDRFATDLNSESDTVATRGDVNSQETESSDTPDNIPNPSEVADENSVVPSAPSYGDVDGAEASPLYVALDDTDPEEPPPPYWQAVGLSSMMMEESSGHSTPRSVVQPTFVDRELNLEKWFRVRQDEHSPLLISLSWIYNRLCCTDKKNGSLSVYDATGEQIVKKYFENLEIGDAAFLETDHEVVRYIVTFLKDHTIMVVSLDSNGITKVEKVIRVKENYTAVCKGPMEHTFIGAVIGYGSPRVEVCDFYGSVVLSIDYPREGMCFGHPSSVAVFKHFAIIADWQLHFVCVYSTQSAGSLRSVYKGEFQNQLRNPRDLEVDHYGNILILEGGRRKIHVINLDSELIAVLTIPAFGLSTSVPRSIALEVIPMMRNSGNYSPRLAVTSLNGYFGIFEIKDMHRAVLRERRTGTEGMLATTVYGPPSER